MEIVRKSIRERFEELVSSVGDGYSDEAHDSVAELTADLGHQEIRALDFYGMETIIDQITPDLPHIDDPDSRVCIKSLVRHGRQNRLIFDAEKQLVTVARGLAQSNVRENVRELVGAIKPPTLFVVTALKAMYIEREHSNPEDPKIQLVNLALSDPYMARIYVADGRLTSDALFGGAAYALYGVLPEDDLTKLREEIDEYRREISEPEFVQGVARASRLGFAEMHAAASVGMLTSPSVERIGTEVRAKSGVVYPDLPKIGCPARHNPRILKWAPHYLLSACEALAELVPQPSKRTNRQSPRKR